MKTILNLKQYMLLLVTAFAMTSCLDSDDPDFKYWEVDIFNKQLFLTEVRKTQRIRKSPTIISEFTPIICRFGILRHD